MSSLPHLLRRAAAAVLVASLAACGGGGGDGGATGGGGPTTPTPTPTPTIGLTAGASTLSVQAGQSGTVTLTVARNGGYAGAVDLALEGAPAGVAGTFTPASVPNGTTAATLALAVASTATPGSYNLTIRGRGTGVADVTVPVALTVTAPPPSPAFTMSVSPATLSVQQGASGTARIAVARSGGFTGPVTVAVTGLPTGVTAGPVTLAGDTATLTVAASAQAAPGAATLTLTGTGTGVTAQTASLALTVTAAPPAGAFTIALSPTTVSAAQGGSATATMNVARTGGFTGGVTLTATGAPAGLTIELPTTAVTGASGPITVRPSATLAAGSYPVTIRAAAAGLPDQTATLTVTVTAASVGSFALTVAPTTIALQQGGTATATVTIARSGGFTGAVDVNVVNLPTGVTARIQPAGAVLRFAGQSLDLVTGGSATITLTAAATANVGSFALQVTGAAAGLPTQTVSVPTTVAQAPAGGNVGYAFCGPSGTLPVWFAVQDGRTGAWRQVAGQVGAAPTVISYPVDVTQSVGGIAWVAPIAPGAFMLMVQYGTRAELQQAASTNCVRGTRRATVTATGLGAGQGALVNLGPVSGSIAAGQASVALDSLPDTGTLDLIASRTAQTIAGTTVTQTVDRIVIDRGLTPGSLTLDFNGARSVAAVARQVTPSGIGGSEGLTLNTILQTAAGRSPFAGTSGTAASLFLQTTAQNAGTAPRTYYAAPASALQPGDAQGLVLTATDASNLTAVGIRFALRYFTAPNDLTLALGPALASPTVTEIASTPYRRWRGQVALQSEYGNIVTLTISQLGTNNAVTRQATVSATAGYTGGGAWDVSLPDLSGAPGWSNTWGIQPGGSITTSIGAGGWDGDLSGNLDGRTVRFGLRLGISIPGLPTIPGFPLATRGGTPLVRATPLVPAAVRRAVRF